MNTDAHVLLTEPIPPILYGLEQHFTVHRLWEMDRTKLIRQFGPRIGAIAVGPKAVVDAELIHALPALGIIAKFGVGYDTIDVEAAARRNVVVTNTAGVPTEEVADFALALLLAAVRQIPQAARYLADGSWGPEQFFPLTATLRGRKVGILGLGAIGKAVARRCEGFGLPVAYYSRTRQRDVPYVYHASPQALAADVDTLFVTAAGGPDSIGLVDAEVLRALGPNGVLVNVARGAIIDQSALVTALRERTILTAALDVFLGEPEVPKELLAFEHIVVTPHTAAGSLHAVLGMCQLVVDNLASWFSGGGPLTPVTETPWKKS
ncbi:2-hydroxyacid dehydrogenase [Nocardia sp. NPDC001965]